jgi:hypothetical protein
MSGWFPKTEENKIVENDGQVTNSVVIENTVNVHNIIIVILLITLPVSFIKIIIENKEKSS